MEVVKYTTTMKVISITFLHVHRRPAPDILSSANMSQHSMAILPAASSWRKGQDCEIVSAASQPLILLKAGLE